MRISDWSSDVCSSDLPRRRFTSRCGRHLPEARLEAREGRGFTRLERPSPRSLVEIMMRQAAQNSLLRFSNSAQLLTSFGRFADRRLSAERSEEHTSELQSLMRISYAVFCLKKKKEI